MSCPRLKMCSRKFCGSVHGLSTSRSTAMPVPVVVRRGLCCSLKAVGKTLRTSESAIANPQRCAALRPLHERRILPASGRNERQSLTGKLGQSFKFT